MEAIVESCAGLDVHQATVVACVIAGSPGKKPKKEIRTFGTMHHELLHMGQFLRRPGLQDALARSLETGKYLNRPSFLGSLTDQFFEP